MSSNKTSDDITKVTLTLMMITGQVVNEMSFTVNCHSNFSGSGCSNLGENNAGLV